MDMEESILNLVKKYLAPAPERKYGLWWSLGHIALFIAAGNIWIAAVALPQDKWIVSLILAIPVAFFDLLE